jgi:hypothetical protein
MRYLDITKNNLTENVALNDFRFKTFIPEIVNVVGYEQNLRNVTNLDEALKFLDTLDLGVAGSGVEIDNIVNNINDSIVFYEGSENTEHVFVHDLNTDIFKYDIWVLEEAGWQNSIVPITIIDLNTVKVELTALKSCRIILQDIRDISKTYYKG